MRTALFAGTVLLFGAIMPVTAVAQSGDVQPQSHQTQVQANFGAARVIVQTSDAPTTYTNAAFVQVTGMGFNIPRGQRGYLVATFTAESSCTAGSWCSVKILCDGVDLLPASGTDFAFDSPGGALYKSLSVTRRSAAEVGRGGHTCEVHTAQVGGSTLRLDDWTFVVEFWRTDPP
jgi:hypothetical protein